jgi:hypothetical protein
LLLLVIQLLSCFCSYIINIVGNLIQIGPLQDQCCIIISKLIEACNADPTKESISVLGKQLQVILYLYFKLKWSARNHNHGYITKFTNLRNICICHLLVNSCILLSNHCMLLGCTYARSSIVLSTYFLDSCLVTVPGLKAGGILCFYRKP